MKHTATVINPKEYKNKRYKVFQIWPGLIVCKQVTICPGHIWTTLYIQRPFRLITSKYLPLKEYGAEVQDVSFF